MLESGLFGAGPAERTVTLSHLGEVGSGEALPY